MDKIILRKIVAADTANIVKWRNSDSVKRNLYTKDDLTEEQHLDWLNTKVKTGLCVQYIIVENDKNATKDIGTVFIKNIDMRNHKGEFGMFIGELSARGNGYGKAAAAEMLKIAFGEIKLNRVYLSVMADNIAAIRCYEKAGFNKEGILKQDHLRVDGYVDVIVMGITRSIYINN